MAASWFPETGPCIYFLNLFNPLLINLMEYFSILLQQLFMTHNFVRDWREFSHLSELPKLEDLCFIGNPLEEENSLSGKWIGEVSKRLLHLKKLDGYPLIRDEVEEVDEDENSILDAEEIERMGKYVW